MKKTLNFYARVLINVNLLSSLPRQLLMDCSSFGFAFVAEVKYERPFYSVCKTIGLRYLIVSIALKVRGLMNK